MTEIHSITDMEAFTFLGQGNTAEIYKIDDTRIIKLFRDSFPENMVNREYQMNVSIQDKFDFVPKTYRMVQYQNRYGIEYEYIHGNDLMKELLQVKKTQLVGKELARLHAMMHSQSGNLAISVREKLEMDIHIMTDLSKSEKEKVLNRLAGLPDGNQICHMDFHPGNVIRTKNGLKVIDWMTACSGCALADVARTCLLFQFGEPMHVSLWQMLMMRAGLNKLLKAYLNEYIAITGVKKEDIMAWTVPIAAARLSEWLSEHERKKLIQYIHKNI